MNKIAIAVGAVFALAATSAFAGPFDQFKGKMKPGLYEMKSEMDMGQVPGMPPGMGKQSMTHQHCITDKEIERGGWEKNAGNKGTESCEIKNMNMSGNTATYTMVCAKPKMSADNKITFTGNGFVMDMNMTMDQQGRTMKMRQHMESKYIGPCK